MKRFEMHCDGFGGVSFDEDLEGMWVDYDDVHKYRAALESIAKNTCCETCREEALVAREALGL